MKKRIEYMLESLTSCVENQLTHLESVDTKELGEAIDMIKDLEEAMYYCVITKAMEEKDESKAYYPVYMRDMDRNYGKMYYEEEPDQRMYDNGSMIQHRESGKGGGSSPWHNGGKNSTPQHERENNPMLMERDEKEGRSPRSRKSYMESKAQHSDKASQMKELETYMQELTSDMVEMVEGSSQEEKQYLSKRIAALANKIQQLND
jgi:hypothetical protein